jgi:hypothetical protein
VREPQTGSGQSTEPSILLRFSTRTAKLSRSSLRPIGRGGPEPWICERPALTIRTDRDLQDAPSLAPLGGGSSKEARMKRKAISRRANFSVKERLVPSTTTEADMIRKSASFDDRLVTLRELTLSIRRMLGIQQVAE